MSDKEFFKQVISEKNQFSEVEEAANTDCSNKHSYVESFSGCVSDWSILKNGSPVQKIEWLTSIWRRLCHILNPCIARLVKE